VTDDKWTNSSLVVPDGPNFPCYDQSIDAWLVCDETPPGSGLEAATPGPSLPGRSLLYHTLHERVQRHRRFRIPSVTAGRNGALGDLLVQYPEMTIDGEPYEVDLEARERDRPFHEGRPHHRGDGPGDGHLDPM